MATRPRRRSGKAKTNADETRQPGWRQPLPKRRRKQQKPLLARKLLSLESPLAGVTLPSRPQENPWDSLKRINWARLNWQRWSVLGVIVILGFAGIQLFTNYQFYVYDAEITGNQRVTSEAIYTASEVDTKSIFWIRPAEVAEKVKTLPGIASASVHVRLPHQVSIEVEERAPLLAWQTTSQTVWVASDGITVPISGPAPTLALVDPDGEAMGQPGLLKAETLAQIRALRTELPELTKVYYGAREGLSFQTPEGWTVYLGHEGAVPAKLALLQALTPEIDAGTASPSVIDLSVEGNAYLR